MPIMKTVTAYAVSIMFLKIAQFLFKCAPVDFICFMISPALPAVLRPVILFDYGLIT